MNYTVGDFVIRIKNAYMARKAEVVTPYSKASLAIGKILVDEKYIKSIKEAEVEGKKRLVVGLLYNGRMPALSGVEIVSRPSVRIYKSKNAVRRGLKDYGVSIVSTSKGMMTDKKANDGKIGGEVICKVF